MSSHCEIEKEGNLAIHMRPVSDIRNRYFVKVTQSRGALGTWEKTFTGYKDGGREEKEGQRLDYASSCLMILRMYIYGCVFWVEERVEKIFYTG